MITKWIRRKIFREKKPVKAVEKPEEKPPQGKPNPFYQGRKYGWPSDGVGRRNKKSNWVKDW